MAKRISLLNIGSPPYDEATLMELAIPDVGSPGGYKSRNAKISDVSGGPSLFKQIANVTVANTATETTLMGSGVGDLTIPANFFTVGRTLRLTGMGFHGATGGPTIRIRIYLGTTVIADTGAVSTGAGTNDFWEVRALITALTLGVSGTLHAQGFYIEAGAGTNLFGMINTSAVTLDTTIAQLLKVTAQWGTANPSNTITLSNFLLEQR